MKTLFNNTNLRREKMSSGIVNRRVNGRDASYRLIGENGDLIPVSSNAPLYAIMAVVGVVVICAVLVPVFIFATQTTPTTTTTTTTTSTTVATTIATTAAVTTVASTTAAPTTTLPPTTIATTVATTTVAPTTAAPTTVPTTASPTTTTKTTTTTTTTIPITTTPGPPLYSISVPKIRVVGIVPQISNPTSGCPIIAADLEGSSSSIPSYLFSVASFLGAAQVYAQETYSITPPLVDYCPADMVFATYPDKNALTPSGACSTSKMYFYALTSADPTGNLYKFPFVFHLVDAQYIKPVGNTPPSPPPSSIVLTRFVYYAWYLPIVRNCLAVTGPVCTSVGTLVAYDESLSIYPSTAPGIVLIDPIINPTNATSANQTELVTMLQTFYNATFFSQDNSTTLAYGNIGPKNLTMGYFEFSSTPRTSQVPVLDPNVFPHLISKREVAPLVNKVRRQTSKFFMCENTALVGCDPFPNQRARGAVTTAPPIRTPVISSITTTSYYQEVVVAMNIKQSYSNTGVDYLYAALTLTGGNYLLGSRVIAQQTQFYCPLLQTLVDCPSDMTFKSVLYWDGTQGVTDPITVLAVKPAARSNPFSYATATLAFVPTDGPYQYAATLTVNTSFTSANFFHYSPRMVGVDGSCVCNGIATCNRNDSAVIDWNLSANDFQSYPIIPVDPVWNPENSCFTTRLQYFSWATAKAQVYGSLISSNMPTMLAGAVEFATRTIPTSVYVATGPVEPTETPAPGFPCEAIVDCTTGVSTPLQVDESRCVGDDETVICVYKGPPTNSSSIVYTGEQCQCLV